MTSTRANSQLEETVSILAKETYTATSEIKQTAENCLEINEKKKMRMKELARLRIVSVAALSYGANRW